MTRFYFTLKSNIRITILIALGLFCLLGQLQAQEGCYEKTRYGGVAAMNKKDYDKAIKWFEQAKGCPDKPSNNDLDNLIKNCRNEKKRIAENKKKAEEQRKQLAEEQRLQEEREQWELEQAELREMEMAENAYMDIKGCDFYNYSYGTLLSKDFDMLYAEDIVYLLPVLSYDGLADEDKEVTLYCKLIGPNGITLTDEDSPYGFSFSQDVTIESGTDNRLRLESWGRDMTFTPGNYALEVYSSNNGKMIHRSYCSLLEKVPVIKTATITFKVDDYEANIFVNDVDRGKRQCTLELEYGAQCIVESRRPNYSPSTKSVTVSKDMDGQVVKLDNPTPIYGSISIATTPKSAEVYLDGINKGTTPLTIPELLIGEHRLELTKKGYDDYYKGLTIKQNFNSPLDIKMNRSKSYRPFASVFLDAVYGFTDDPLVGGQFAVCTNRVGFYGQYLHGIEHHSYTATGGLVFRLTRDHIDFQLSAGAGYGSIYEYYYNYYNGDYNHGYRHKESFLLDAGARIGWRSKVYWSFFDLMGGCMFNMDGEAYPYVGVGTGLSLAAAIAVILSR